MVFAEIGGFTIDLSVHRLRIDFIYVQLDSNQGLLARSGVKNQRFSHCLNRYNQFIVTISNAGFQIEPADQFFYFFSHTVSLKTISNGIWLPDG